MFNWLLSTKPGQWISKIIAAIGILFIIFKFGKNKGRQQEQQKQQKQELEAHEARNDIEDKINKTSDPVVDSGLSPWLRDKK